MNLVNSNLLNKCKGIVYNLIGCFYYEISITHPLAEKYFTLAYKLNNDDATFNLGLYYGNIRQYHTMLKYYILASELGKDEAFYKLGYYYQYIEINYELMKKYYDKHIDKTSIISSSTYNLGCYYQYIKKDYEMMKEHYNIVIENNMWDMRPIYKLGYYYQYVEKNYTQMKKYYLMGIDLGEGYKHITYGDHYHSNVEYYTKLLISFGNYYKKVEKNYTLMEKYYMEAIEFDDNNTTAMINLADYYKKQKNYKLMKEYYKTAIKLKNTRAMTELADYHKEHKNYGLMKRYYMMGFELNNTSAKINLKKYFKNIEKNVLNYYAYIYYPRILALIICSKKRKIFLPEELLNKIIYETYICIENN